MEIKFKHFVALNVLDVMLTWYALTYTGLSEGNPILSPIFHEVGLVKSLIAIKLLVLMVIYALINKMPLYVKFKGIDGRKIATNTICFMFVLVVANNIYQIVQRL